MAEKIINPLNNSRFIDVTGAFRQVQYPYGVFSKTGLFTPDYLTTTTAIAQVDHKGLGKMTGFTSREQRDAQRTAKQRNRATALAIPHIKLAEAVTYEDFAGRVADWSGLTQQAREITLSDATLDRLERMSLSMTQSHEYLSLTATQGAMRDPEDGTVWVDMFEELNVERPQVTLDLNDQTLDVIAWSMSLRESIQKRNKISPVVPVIDILVSSVDMQAIQSHNSVSALRANLLVGNGLAGVANASRTLYSQVVLTEHGVGQVFDLQNGVRFITYPASFYRRDGSVVEATVTGKAHTILRGVTDLYRVAYAPAPYFSTLGQKGTETYAWRTPVTNDQHFEVGVESSPLYYMTQPELSYDITIVPVATGGTGGTGSNP